MSQAEEIAKTFEAVNAQAIAAVEACTDADWAKTTAAEGWTVAALAHHVAAGHEGIANFVQAIATGQQLPPGSPADFDAANAQHASEFKSANKAETLQILREGGAKAAAAVRALSDEQLTRAGNAFGQEMTAAQAAQGILIGHIQGHLESLKAATG